MTETIEKCPECGNHELFHNKANGDTICRECGFVVEDISFDFGPEWSEFEVKDTSKRRVGAPVTYLQPELTTQIGQYSDLAKLNSTEREKFLRLRKWQRRSANSVEQNLNQSLSILKTASSALNLSKPIEEESARLYTEILRKGLVKGRSIERLVAGCIFVACKTFNIPKTLNEISKATSVNLKDLGKSYKFVARTLDLKLLPSSPIEFVAKFASVLDLTPKTQTKAIELIEKAKEKDLTNGKNPSSIAIAALYLASLMNKEKRTQLQMAQTANISDVTLRKVCKELVEKLRIKTQI